MKKTILYSLFLFLLGMSFAVLHAQEVTGAPNQNINSPSPQGNESSSDSQPNASDKLSSLQEHVTSLRKEMGNLGVYLDNLQTQLTNAVKGLSNTAQVSQEDRTKVQSLQAKLMDTDMHLKSLRDELDAAQNQVQDILKSHLFEDNATAPSQELSKRLDAIEKRLSHVEGELEKILNTGMHPTANKQADKQIQKNLEDNLAPEVQTGDATITTTNNAIKIKLDGNILFRSGEVSISQEGERTLDKLVPILKSLKDKVVFVIGHADSVPIGPSLKDFYPTNWELSTTRGTMVVRYLQQMGVPPSILVAAGRSFYEPDPGGMDRRAEIWIFPKLSSDFQSVDSSV